MYAITMCRTVISFARISILLLFAAFASVSKAPAQIVGVSITVAPPVLPVYDQPPLPGPGYMWTPGYWAWDDGDYYWVPGTWVEPPAVGLLWTPGYWGWRDGIYVWNAGYWGPHIGFYGGVNYGFGYVGVGYAGGFWRGGVFSYNSTVNNFGGVHITNVYNKTVVVNNVNNHVSFNGGTGGLTARPNQQELAAVNERHVPPTNAQTQHQQQASTNKGLRASVNGGHPVVAATTHAGHFEGAGVMAAHHDGAAGGGPKGPAALSAHGPGGANPPKVNNASLNAGQGQHPGGGTGPQPGRGGGPGQTGGGTHTGGPPGGFRPGGSNPPKVANVAKPSAHGPAPRKPAPHQLQHH
jgi:hypothetical protein